MRVVLDTNVLVSALLAQTSLPAHLVTLWRQGKFVLLTSAEQLDELMRVTRYPKIRARLEPALAGRLVNQLRTVATLVERLPAITVCADPNDNFLLATASAGMADVLITGDKADLLVMQRFEATRIMSVRQFLTAQGALPGPA